MRAIIPILLILILFISSFKHAAIFVSFKLNQAYIAQNLCVERDVVESTCGGCCQLKKKQNEQSETEDNTSPERKVRVSGEWFCIKTIALSAPNSINHSQKHFHSLNFYQSKYQADCFRPPPLA